MPPFLLPFAAIISSGWSFISGAGKAVGSFFASLPRWLQISIVAVLAIALWSWWLGQHEFDRGVAAQIAIQQKAEDAAKAQARQKEKDGGAVTTKIDAEVTADHQTIQINTDALLKEIPNVTLPAGAQPCFVPLGFVRIHDAAAFALDLSRLPAGTYGADATDAGVPCGRFLSVVVGNYGTGWVFKRDVDRWQEWYVKQAAIYQGAPPR